MADPVPVIAIDGPSGVGKGTIAYRLARRLGFRVLDSGALYRLLAVAAEQSGVPLDDEDGLARLALTLDVDFRLSPQDELIEPLLAGRSVTASVRSQSTAESASRLAVFAGVRAGLLERQRALRRAPGLVADGRDMGTVVFPDAAVKIYLTASPEERAQRRYKQLIAKGIGVNLATLRGEIAARDKRDRERTVAPLRPASDAVIIDTTDLSAEAVFDRVMEIVGARGVTMP